MNINELLLSTELYNLLKVIFEPITFFTDTNKRLYLGYFFGCIVIITTVYGLQSIKFKALVKASFSKHYWLNQSSLIDVQWLFVNQAIKGVIVIPLFLSQISLTMSVYRWLTDVFGVGNFLTHTKSTVIIIFTLTLFVVDDFSRFFIHYLYHKVPFLWRFHSIHHSANVLTPVTLYRVHFVEYLFNTMRSILVAGLLGGFSFIALPPLSV